VSNSSQFSRIRVSVFGLHSSWVRWTCNNF